MTETDPVHPRLNRRRRENVTGGRQHRHVVKVSPEEEGVLVRLAGAERVSVPRLLVEAALAAEAGESVTGRRDLVVELFAVHRLLAAISNNVNQIARATNATHEHQEETAAALGAVRRTAERIDALVDGLSAR